MIIIICGGNFNCWRDADDDGESQFKALGDFVAAANPATINELLDRLEAAEKERDEFKRACFGHISDNSLLRAKIAEMEKQEPVAFALYSGWAFKAAYHKEHEACDQRDRRQLSADLGGSLEAYRVVPLYALPGAKEELK